MTAIVNAARRPHRALTAECLAGRLDREAISPTPFRSAGSGSETARCPSLLVAGARNLPLRSGRPEWAFLRSCYLIYANSTSRKTERSNVPEHLLSPSARPRCGSGKPRTAGQIATLLGAMSDGVT